MAVSENKSFVVLEENDKADAAANYRYFLASFDKFDEVSRSRFIATLSYAATVQEARTLIAAVPPAPAPAVTWYIIQPPSLEVSLVPNP
mgnify:CR=1 FL=1